MRHKRIMNGINKIEWNGDRDELERGREVMKEMMIVMMRGVHFSGGSV